MDERARRPLAGDDGAAARDPEGAPELESERRVLRVVDEQGDGMGRPELAQPERSDGAVSVAEASRVQLLRELEAEVALLLSDSGRALSTGDVDLFVKTTVAAMHNLTKQALLLRAAPNLDAWLVNVHGGYSEYKAQMTLDDRRAWVVAYGQLVHAVAFVRGDD